MDDRREVGVVEVDLLEAAVPVLEHVEQAGDLVADGRLADQVAQVALAGDEADDRRGPGSGGGLGELGDLLTCSWILLGSAIRPASQRTSSSRRRTMAS